MARSYSLDLRERAIARVLAGDSIRAVGAAFATDPSVVSKWSSRLRATGSVSPGEMGGQDLSRAPDRKDVGDRGHGSGDQRQVRPLPFPWQ
jgi:transposase